MFQNEFNVDPEGESEVQRARRLLEGVWSSDIDEAHRQNGCAERLSLEVAVEMSFPEYYAPRMTWYLRQKHVEGLNCVICRRPVPAPQIEIVNPLWAGEDCLGSVVGIVTVGGLERQTHHAKRRMAVETLMHAVANAWTDLCNLHNVGPSERVIKLFPTVQQVLDGLKGDFHD